MRRWLMAAAVCLCAAPALAQDTDADGSKDHPRLELAKALNDHGRARNRRVELLKK